MKCVDFAPALFDFGKTTPSECHAGGPLQEIPTPGLKEGEDAHASIRHHLHNGGDDRGAD